MHAKMKPSALTLALWISTAWIGLLPLGLAAPSPDFQAGVARVRITPPTPFWLSGYASRTNPAPTVRSDLWAKALALEDDNHNRAVLVTTDLIGLPAEVTEAAARRLAQTQGIARSQVLFNSSHTHAGPAIWPNLRVMFDFTPAEQERVHRYSQQLVDHLVDVATRALTNLAPARLATSTGEATFAINRRQPTPAGFRIGLGTNGPVDHRVPVLQVTALDGQLRAVLFGYACHNTTLGGDTYEIDADYAGAAQRALEQRHPGTTALFLMLCGGDQNPNPRGTFARVDEHGHALAAAVDAVLEHPLRPITPPIRTAWVRTHLEFAPHQRTTFEAEAAKGNKFEQRRARLMLDAYDAGHPVRDLDYPVQAVRLGHDLALLALGGEVVVDYSRRAQAEFPHDNLVVAGYCNDVACYIPSRRVLREGGYEAVDSMIYYGQPGPFAESVEDTLWKAALDALAQVGLSPR
jgi:hypothetical protein